MLFSNLYGTDKINIILDNMSIYQIANEWKPSIDTSNSNYFIYRFGRVYMMPLRQENFDICDWKVVNLLNDKFCSMRKFSEDVLLEKISLEEAEEKLKGRINQLNVVV